MLNIIYDSNLSFNKYRDFLLLMDREFRRIKFGYLMLNIIALH